MVIRTFFLFILFIPPTFILATQERLSCEWLLTKVNDGKSFIDVRRYLDEQLLKDTVKSQTEEEFNKSGALASVFFEKFPADTLNHLKDFVLDESLPIRARQLALTKILDFGSKGKAPVSLQKEIVSTAKEFVNSYLNLQEMRLDGTLPSDFQLTTSLALDDIAARYRGLVGKMASDAELFASQSLKVLAEISPPAFNQVMEKLANLYDEHMQEEPTIVHKAVLSELTQVLHSLALNMKDPKAGAKTLEILAKNGRTLQQTLDFVGHYYPKQASPELDKVIEQIDKKSSEHLSLALKHYSNNFSALYLEADLIGKLRSFHSYSNGKPSLLADRIKNELNEAKGRALAKSELYRLFSNILEINYRSHNPKAKEPLENDASIVKSMQELLEKLAQDAKKNRHDEYEKKVKNPHLDINTYRLLSDTLVILNENVELWNVVKRNPKIAALVLEISKDEHPEDKEIFGTGFIYGPVSVGYADRLLKLHP